MIILLWALGIALIAGMMVFMAYASTMGGVGVLTQSRYERCPQCGHHGLVHEGRLHPAACPESASIRVSHLLHAGHGRIHIRHH